MRLVVKLDGANPHPNWQPSATPSPRDHHHNSSNNNNNNSLQVSPRFFHGQQHLGTSFTVDDENDVGNLPPELTSSIGGDDVVDKSNNNDPKIVTINNDNGDGDDGGTLTVKKHQSRLRRSRNNLNQQHNDADEAAAMRRQEHMKDVLDPNYNEDKTGFGLSVDGPTVVVTPNDRRVVNHNRQSAHMLAGRVDSLNTTMRHQINNIRHQEKIAHDELQRISQSTSKQTAPRQLPAMLQPEQEALRGRVVNFVENETEAQENGREPVLGEFLDQLQQIATLRHNRQLHRDSNFSENPPPGVGANFDGSYINVNGLGGATAPIASSTAEHPATMPNSWQMPSWVMRQGYSYKQQLLLHKAQQQLTPILKQQSSNKTIRDPMIINSRSRTKSPSTKRVSWSERVDAIAIPLQSNSDKPLRKPGRRQRSISPKRTVNVVRQPDDIDDIQITQHHRSPRPGSSEAAILDRLAQHQNLIVEEPIATATVGHRRGNVMVRHHRQMSRSNNNKTPNSQLSFTVSGGGSNVPAQVATTPLMNGGIFGAFPASDDASLRSSRTMLRSALRLSNSKEDVAVLRRWRSLEAVLHRRNLSQHFAQIRHRAFVNGQTSLATKGVAPPKTPPQQPSGRQSPAPTSNNNSWNQPSQQPQPAIGGAQMKLFHRQTSSTGQHRTITNQTPPSSLFCQPQQPSQTLIINNSSMTMAPTATMPLNLLRVAKIDPDSYHVSLGIRLPATASLTNINNHHGLSSTAAISGPFITTAISAGR